MPSHTNHSAHTKRSHSATNLAAHRNSSFGFTHLPAAGAEAAPTSRRRQSQQSVTSAGGGTQRSSSKDADFDDGASDHTARIGPKRKSKVNIAHHASGLHRRGNASSSNIAHRNKSRSHVTLAALGHEGQEPGNSAKRNQSKSRTNVRDAVPDEEAEAGWVSASSSKAGSPQMGASPESFQPLEFGKKARRNRGLDRTGQGKGSELAPPETVIEQPSREQSAATTPTADDLPKDIPGGLVRQLSQQGYLAPPEQSEPSSQETPKLEPTPTLEEPTPMLEKHEAELIHQEEQKMGDAGYGNVGIPLPENEPLDTVLDFVQAPPAHMKSDVERAERLEHEARERMSAHEQTSKEITETPEEIVPDAPQRAGGRMSPQKQQPERQEQPQPSLPKEHPRPMNSRKMSSSTIRSLASHHSRAPLPSGLRMLSTPLQPRLDTQVEGHGHIGERAPAAGSQTDRESLPSSSSQHKGKATQSPRPSRHGSTGPSGSASSRAGTLTAAEASDLAKRLRTVSGSDLPSVVTPGNYPSGTARRALNRSLSTASNLTVSGQGEDEGGLKGTLKRASGYFGSFSRLAGLAGFTSVSPTDPLPASAHEKSRYSPVTPYSPVQKSISSRRALPKPLISKFIDPEDDFAPLPRAEQVRGTGRQSKESRARQKLMTQRDLPDSGDEQAFGNRSGFSSAGPGTPGGHLSNASEDDAAISRNASQANLRASVGATSQSQRQNQLAPSVQRWITALVKEAERIDKDHATAMRFNNAVQASMARVLEAQAKAEEEERREERSARREREKIHHRLRSKRCDEFDIRITPTSTMPPKKRSAAQGTAPAASSSSAPREVAIPQTESDSKPLVTVLRAATFVPSVFLQIIIVAYCVFLLPGRPSSFSNLNDILEHIVSNPSKALVRIIAGLTVAQFYLGYSLKSSYEKARSASSDTASGDEQVQGSDGLVSKTTSATVIAAGETIASTLIGAVYLFAAALIMGAPLDSTKALDTALLALFLSVLAFLPALYALGSPYLPGKKDRKNIQERWIEAVMAFYPLNDVELALIAPVYGTVIGALLGAYPIALDWEEPWQKWPATVIVGATVGWAIGQLISLAGCTLAWLAKGKGYYRLNEPNAVTDSAKSKKDL